MPEFEIEFKQIGSGFRDLQRRALFYDVFKWTKLHRMNTIVNMSYRQLYFIAYWSRRAQLPALRNKLGSVCITTLHSTHSLPYLTRVRPVSYRMSNVAAYSIECPTNVHKK